MQNFKDQVAIVTGGFQGLGRAISEVLVANGCSVLVFDIAGNEDTCSAILAKAPPGAAVKCLFHKVDVSDEESVRGGFQFFQSQFDRLDIMVNCAGIVGPNAIKTEDIKTADFDKVYAVNTRGSFLMTKYSLVEMKKRDYGRILLIASIAGKEGNAGMSPYSMSKAAVIGFVKAVGKEYAETGITVNALAPAVVRTAMVENMDQGQVKYMTDKIPMKRCCKLEEVASTVKFIVSKEASFNTGYCFDLTGGRAVY